MIFLIFKKLNILQILLVDMIAELDHDLLRQGPQKGVVVFLCPKDAIFQNCLNFGKKPLWDIMFDLNLQEYAELLFVRYALSVHI